MKIDKVGEYSWKGISKDVKSFEIRLRESKDDNQFQNFISALPLDAAYPKKIILSESDTRPGEFRFSKNHFIVEFDNKIIGALSFHPGSEHDYHFRHGIRVHINILPLFVHMGFGNVLLNVFEQYAREEMFYRISTGTIATNIAAIKLFLKNGFQIEGRTKRALKLRFKNQNEELKGKNEIFVDAILLGKWIGPDIKDYEHQF